MTENENKDTLDNMIKFDLNSETGINNSVDDLLAETDTPQTSSQTDIDDDFMDFNDFSIEDLDTALKKYNNLDSTSLQNEENASAPMQTLNASPDNKPVENVPSNGSSSLTDNVSASTATATSSTDTLSDALSENTASAPSQTISANSVEAPKTMAISSEIEDNNNDYSQENIDKKYMGNLIWYDGSLDEKVYEISLNNMPEFLDYNSEIKTIHVNIESPYGWNVFFENGVFMNLMDLKEYQERHGSLPGHNGKIIYGNRMSSFEKIERIVVYSKPRYFAYGLKK